MKYLQCLLAVASAALLSGCPDSSQVEAKVDRLQAKFDVLGQILQKQDELARAAMPSSCVLTDYDRNEQVGVLATNYPVAIGDRIFIGDDMWTVQAAKLFTSELPVHLRNPQVPKAYRINNIELLVKFEGKGRKPPSAKETETTPK